MPIDVDSVRLNFAPEHLKLLNVLLGFVMFGVALTLKPFDFKRIYQNPKSSIVGFTSQFFLLPALTFLIVILLKPVPSVALGMFLVAACPGGNMSNFISMLAKGNAALSVSLTAYATIAAIVLTPLNFSLWAGLYPDTSNLLKEISISPWEMMETVLVLLGIPLFAGMWFAYQFPKITRKITKPIHFISILIFVSFLVVAFASNWNYFMQFIKWVVILVLIHNGIALISGYLWSSLWKLPKRDRRAISIETGIQNTGLGLVLIFKFFDGLGGMAVVAGWWGIWDLIAGLAIAYIWSKRLALDSTS